jgi:hypothetical protein
MIAHLWLTVVTFHLMVLLVPAALVVLYCRPSLWHSMLAFSSGMLVGFINLHTAETQVPALLLLLFGLFLGFDRPARAWCWALLLAFWVPVGSFGRILFGDGGGALVNEGVGSLLAFVFSFAGSYLGAGLAWLVRRKAGGAPG